MCWLPVPNELTRTQSRSSVVAPQLENPNEITCKQSCCSGVAPDLAYLEFSPRFMILKSSSLLGLRSQAHFWDFTSKFFFLRSHQSGHFWNLITQFVYVWFSPSREAHFFDTAVVCIYWPVHSPVSAVLLRIWNLPNEIPVNSPVAAVFTPDLVYTAVVSYTPGLGLCPDRFKGGTRDVEHRNGVCILHRPEEAENERWSTVKQWAPPDDTRYEHSPETSPLFHVETPNTVTSISRHRVREHPQQPPCSLLGERDNIWLLIISYHGGSNQYHKNLNPRYFSYS